MLEGKKQKGFTLVELLVAIAVIGLVATLSMVSLQSARIQARNTRRLTDLRQIRSALELYQNDHQGYPVSTGGAGVWDGLYSSWGDSSTNWIDGLSPTYIAQLPRDPRNDTDPTRQYLYRSDGTDYKLISHQPEDCVGFVTTYPEIADPTRDCWAFGFYTPGAQNW